MSTCYPSALVPGIPLNFQTLRLWSDHGDRAVPGVSLYEAAAVNFKSTPISVSLAALGALLQRALLFQKSGL